MEHAGNSSHVNEHMQFAPTFSTQPLNHFVGGSYGKRNHQEKGQHPEGNEGALQYIAGNARKLEEAVKPDIRDEMEGSIKNANKPSMRRNLTSQFRPVI